MKLTPPIKDWIETIQSLPDLEAALTSLLRIPGGVALALLFFLWLAIRSDYLKIFKTLEYKSRRRIEQINEYIASPDLADLETLTEAKDQRDAHYFKIATGIHAEGTTRNGLIKLHKALSHSITWTHIRRAYQYISVNIDQSITIRELAMFEKFYYWYNQAIAYLLMGFAAFLACAAIIMGNQSVTSFALWASGAILAGVFSIIVHSQNWPVHAKNRIKEEMQRKDTPMHSLKKNKIHTRTTQTSAPKN